NQLNQQGNPRAYVHALLREGEQVYADVGLHLKGNASFRPLGDRPCLTVKFDEFHAGQNFHGLTKIHLNNSLQDPSFLTMVLCEGLFNAADVPTPRSTYAQVKINGRDRGLYILNEGFDKKFL